MKTSLCRRSGAYLCITQCQFQWVQVLEILLEKKPREGTCALLCPPLGAPSAAPCAAMSISDRLGPRMRSSFDLSPTLEPVAAALYRCVAPHPHCTDLQASWEVEDEGEVQDLLNIEISRDGHDVILKQTNYICKMLDTYAPDGVPARFQSSRGPCNDRLVHAVCDALSSNESPDPALIRKYQSLVGALLYCSTQTRPDVAYTVGYLGRAMSKPTPELYELALHVLYYLYLHRMSVSDTLPRIGPSWG